MRGTEGSEGLVSMALLRQNGILVFPMCGDVQSWSDLHSGFCMECALFSLHMSWATYSTIATYKQVLVQGPISDTGGTCATCTGLGREALMVVSVLY